MIKFFDANCTIGKRNVHLEGSPKTMDDFVDMMRICGIEKAIVNHSCAREHDMMLGNLMLSEEISDRPEFIKQWSIMPACVDEFPDKEELFVQMKKHNVKCVRIDPASFQYSLEPFSFGEFAKPLAEKSIPVFVDKSQIMPDQITNILRYYPDLKFILTDVGYRSMRQLKYLMKEFDNLYIETSTFVSHNGIKHFVEEFGAERFIFGSGMPKASSAASVSLIRYSDISNQDKEKIAHKNIETLLKEVRL